MSVLYVSHPSSGSHATGPGHPERPERLSAIREAMEASGLPGVVDLPDPPAVDRELLERVHSPSYAASIDSLAASGGGWLDSDTRVAPRSAEAARYAAGAAQRAAEALCSGEASRAFVGVRPPGHHALPDRGMGFCLFNNAAVAAAAARAAGRQRVMIVDWDVHHGNGTQEVFWRDPSVLFVSLHQEFWYPGTGALEEIGAGDGEGLTVNLPLPAETGDAGYEEAFTEVVLPLAAAFKPEFLIVSAGYDAHFADPLGAMVLTARGFGRMAGLLDEAARALDAPMMAVLEGGYDLAALGASAVATVEPMVGRVAWRGDEEASPPEAARALVAPRLRAARRRLHDHWRI